MNTLEEEILKDFRLKADGIGTHFDEYYTEHYLSDSNAMDDVEEVIIDALKKQREEIRESIKALHVNTVYGHSSESVYEFKWEVLNIPSLKEPQN